MGCCSTPSVTLKATQAFSRLAPVIDWNDGRCRFGGSRAIQWEFYVNGRLVITLPFAAPATVAPIGVGSTYAQLNANASDILAWLAGQGVLLVPGQLLTVKVRIRNCRCITELSESVVIPIVVVSTCNCDFVSAYSIGQTGTTSVPPGGYLAVGGELVLLNGLLNYAGNTFAQPLDPADELSWLTFDAGCTAAFDVVVVTGQANTVAVPPAFAALPVTDYLLVRNGLFQTNYTVSAGALTPSIAPSDPLDEWAFVRLTGASGCRLQRISAGSSVTGTTVTLPAGFSAANQNKWRLVVNGVLGYPAAASVNGYSVTGNVATPEMPFNADEIWLIVLS